MPLGVDQPALRRHVASALRVQHGDLSVRPTYLARVSEYLHSIGADRSKFERRVQQSGIGRDTGSEDEDGESNPGGHDDLPTREGSQNGTQLDHLRKVPQGPTWQEATTRDRAFF